MSGDVLNDLRDTSTPLVCLRMISILNTNLKQKLIKDTLLKEKFVRENSLCLACNETCLFFFRGSQTLYLIEDHKHYTLVRQFVMHFPFIVKIYAFVLVLNYTYK